VQRNAARVVLAILLGVAGAWAICGRPAAAANDTGITVEASPQVFTTLCALAAAGFNVDDSALEGMPARRALRSELQNTQGPATDAVREFYRSHALGSSSESLSRYVTFALVVGPPPAFQYQTNREQLPPDVLTIEEFREILPNFYQEAHLRLNWAAVQSEDEPSLARYRASLARIVAVSNGYLREIMKDSRGRTFTVYVEPFVGAQTNFRDYGDRYMLVVGTPAELPEGTMRHAYLHFALDPVVLRNRPLVDTKRALLRVAAAAPRLPVEYRDDFIGLMDECLVKAVELRLRHLKPEELEAALKDADQSGFVLVRPLVGGLQKFEKAEPAISYYFADLIAGIDVAAEQKRLQVITFASGPAIGAEQHGGTEADEPSEVDRWIAQGNREIARKDASAAATTCQGVLERYPNNPRALYGLAVASVLGGKAARAKELFEQVISSSGGEASASADSGAAVEPEVLAWSHVYLGRIYDLHEDRDAAVAEYRAALTVRGAPESARAAAQGGIETAYQPPAVRGNVR
jgi:Tetratricopeptide repeat